MRLVGKCSFALIGLFGVLGCAGVAAAADSVDVTMAPQSGSSESGTATLTKEGAGTKVVVNLPGATGQPAHIHKGTCSNLDPKPTYPLSPVANGKSETVVKAPLDDLLKGGYAINVHKSVQDLKTYVSCGEIAAK